jgi:hypothetical protein
LTIPDSLLITLSLDEDYVMKVVSHEGCLVSSMSIKSDMNEKSMDVFLILLNFELVKIINEKNSLADNKVNIKIEEKKKTKRKFIS